MKIGRLVIDGKDLVFSLLFVTLGTASCVYVLQRLSIQGTFGLGPGFFPVAISAIIVILALLVGLLAIGKPTAPVQLASVRSFLFLIASPIVFGLTIRTLGMVLAIPLAVAVAALASRRITMMEVFFLAVGFGALSVVLFHYLLRMNVPLFGSLLF